MNTPEFSTVWTTRTAGEADVIIATLRNAGFHPLDLNTASNFSLAGADISYHIELPTSELSAAKEFLRSIDDTTQSPEQG